MSHRIKSSRQGTNQRLRRPIVASLSVATILIGVAGVVGVASHPSDRVYVGRSTPDQPSEAHSDEPNVDIATSALGPPIPGPTTESTAATQLKRTPAGAPNEAVTEDGDRNVATGPDPQLAIPPRFLSDCEYSHSAKDDPIVHYGQPGGSHSHDFFGNTSTNAFSTDQTMSVQGTTCRRTGDTAGYWVPTLQADGQTVRAKLVAYYAAQASVAPTVKAFPQGLKIVAGHGRGVRWQCLSRDGRSFRLTLLASPTCTTGERLVLKITFPNCWDGRDTDSPDHQSHMAYASAKDVCPASDPVPVPQLVLEFIYPTNGVSKVALSSGGPETAHADFLNSWNQRTLDALITGCINAHRDCAGGGP